MKQHATINYSMYPSNFYVNRVTRSAFDSIARISACNSRSRGSLMAFAILCGFLSGICAMTDASAQYPTAMRTFPESVMLGEPFTVNVHVTPGPGKWSLTELAPPGFTAHDISHGGVFVSSTREIRFGPFNEPSEQTFSFRLVPTELSLGTSVVPVGGPESRLFPDLDRFPVPDPAFFQIKGPKALFINGPVFQETDLAPGPGLPGPFIIANPVAQTVWIGGIATFVAQASGKDPLTYQWYHNGRPIPGARASVRLIRNITKIDSGYYYLIVTDREGRRAVTRPVFLDVRAPTDPPPGPSILRHPRDKEVVLNRSATFSVDATGQGPISFQWYRDGVAMPDANKSTVMITNVSESDAGVYHARVKDINGRSVITHGAVLSVVLPEPFMILREDNPGLCKVLNLVGSYTSGFQANDASIHVEYNLTHNQYGRLSGAGHVTIRRPGGDFISHLEVHGNIRTIGKPEDLIHRVKLILRAIDDDAFKLNVIQIVDVDTANQRLIGEAHGYMDIREDQYIIAEEAHETTLPPGRDGNWSLLIKPPLPSEPYGHATLGVQGDVLTYWVTHHHMPIEEIDIYHLRGACEHSRGRSLRVDTNADNLVVRMFGHAKGQRLNVTVPPPE